MLNIGSTFDFSEEAALRELPPAMSRLMQGKGDMDIKVGRNLKRVECHRKLPGF
jgi:hypothetical protein